VAREFYVRGTRLSFLKKTSSRKHWYQSHSHTQCTNRDMGCGVRVWVRIEIRLSIFQPSSPDGSAIASRGTYFQMTDADSFITCVQMATRAPSCINYSWLVHMRMNMNMNMRKRAVPRSKLQLGHHYIRKSADAFLWVPGRNFYILSTI
jgi:hypothetical protein